MLSNLGFGIGAVIIELIIIYNISVENIINSSRSRFKWLVLVLLVYTIHSLAVVFVDDIGKGMSPIVPTILTTLGYVYIFAFGLCFSSYMYSYSKAAINAVRYWYYVLSTALVVILLILNFFIHLVFYYNSDYVYCKGSLFLVPTFVVVSYLVLSFITMLRHIDSFSKVHRFAVILLFVGIIVVIALRFFIAIDTMFIVFIVACGVLEIYVSMETPDYAVLQKTVVELDDARRQADKASESKTQYLAGMSHEIRTPINAALGMNEMILRESTEPQIIEYALASKKAGEALLSIINDVLDVSKIESGKLETVNGDFDLEKIINDSYTMVADKIVSKGLDFKLDLEESLPKAYNGDGTHLRQIMVNLLNNAVKYTERGSITLKVSGFYSLDTMTLMIDVIDTGVGIKDEDKKFIFEQYNRTSNMKQIVEVEGTGLGLKLVDELVALMGGTVEMDSIYGLGSRFSIRLPFKVIDTSPIGEIELGALTYDTVNRNKAGFKAPSAKVLIVDDLEDNLTIARLLLKETEVSVDTALSGTEALDMVAVEKYDIIFMDHLMPGMDGIETLTEIRKLPLYPNKNTPVIMLTANAIAGLKEKYEEAGFADYITKPIVNRSLENMLLKYLPEDKIIRNE